MFAVLIPHRPIYTTPTQISPTQAAFPIPHAESLNHVCVFLTNPIEMPLEPGMGAGVFFFWPGKGFQMLGILSNEKPSAIYRLRGVFTPAAAAGDQHSFMAQAAQQQAGDEGIISQIGISLEPIQLLEAQLHAAGTLTSAAQVVAPSTLADPKVLAEKVAKNLFDYLGSFFPDPSTIGPDSAVPMGAIKRWYETFIGKVERVGVGFLERSEG